ncbi:MAG: RNA polymerase sigma factor [Planctomycetota bacterium]
MAVVQRRARSQEHASWLLEQLRAHEGPLLRYARRLLPGDEERARDVVQDTFLKLCAEPREKVEGHAREWLFRVCRNRAFDVRKKEARMTTTEEVGAKVAPEPGPAATTEGKETRSRLLQLVDSLPEKQREVVLLKFQDGLSYKEMARITQQSVGNVGTLLHTAIKTLRQRLEAQDARPDLAIG